MNRNPQNFRCLSSRVTVLPTFAVAVLFRAHPPPQLANPIVSSRRAPLTHAAVFTLALSRGLSFTRGASAVGSSPPPGLALPPRARSRSPEITACRNKSRSPSARVIARTRVPPPFSPVAFSSPLIARRRRKTTTKPRLTFFRVFGNARASREGNRAPSVSACRTRNKSVTTASRSTANVPFCSFRARRCVSKKPRSDRAPSSSPRARRVRPLPCHATTPWSPRRRRSAVPLLPNSPRVRLSRVRRLVPPLLPRRRSSLLPRRWFQLFADRVATLAGQEVEAGDRASRTHVGRVARRDVRERDTWWARVTQTAALPDDVEVCGRASTAPPSPPPVFPSRCRCPSPPPPPSPLRILVVSLTRRGLSRRSWGHWLAPLRAPDARDSI